MNHKDYQLLCLYPWNTKTNRNSVSIFFQFPMVFQGWQALIGFIVLQILSYIPSRSQPTLTVISLDKSGFISLLPNFFLFTVALIAGSKALSHLPVIVCISVGNCVPACIYLLDNLSIKKTSVIQVACSSIVIVSTVPVLLSVPEDETSNRDHIPSSLMDSPKFWLVVQAFSSLAVSLHGRIADARFAAADRLFYSYVFSLIVLLPASLYLEESFQALHFQPSRQIDFVVGSIFSAVVGVAVSLYGIRLKEDEHFGKVLHGGLLVTALFSGILFSTNLPWWGWLASTLNLIALMLVPTHMRKDDNSLTSDRGQISNELPTRVV